jgi:hypothetical protein
MGSIQVIALPPGVTASGILDAILQVYDRYYAGQTLGTQVLVEIGSNQATVVITPPAAYTPVIVPPAEAPTTTQGAPYVPPDKFPPGATKVDALVFQLFAGGGGNSWGSPVSTNGGTLIGGVVEGANVVATLVTDGDFTAWHIIGNPPVRIQEFVVFPVGYPNRVIGRDAAGTSYVYSDDWGVTWTPFTPAQAWQGTGSDGFYN